MKDTPFASKPKKSEDMSKQAMAWRRQVDGSGLPTYTPTGIWKAFTADDYGAVNHHRRPSGGSLRQTVFTVSWAKQVGEFQNDLLTTGRTQHDINE